jgi:ferrochelatase
MSARVAVILFNLGGPDRPEAVRPFLFNLFNDPAILAAPGPVRFGLASLISTLREKSARANYAKMGGASPILKETQAQANALDAELMRRSLGLTTKTFIAMRYWKPFTDEAAAAAKAWGATEAVLLPLYPQFSSSTTASSLSAWKRASALPASAVCCYPDADGFAQAHAEAILEAWRKAGSPAAPRVLFSAHGLPQRTIDRGDSYQWQVERTVAAVQALLPPEWESRICYQSRVGPLKWIGPSTEDEIAVAGAKKQGLIVTPIAFVSEHIETLVELDEEYAELAHESGVPFYVRAPALGVRQGFIEQLADLVSGALARPGRTCSYTGARLCPRAFGLCPMKDAA